MGARERLRLAIDDEFSRLRTGIPPGREAALLSVIRALDGLPHLPGEAIPDVVTGHARPGHGAWLGLRLCLEATDTAASGDIDLTGWADGFLVGCAEVAAAEMVLAHGESGYMRMVEGKPGEIDAWAATKSVPASWRERADIDWWARWSARHNASGLADRPVEDRYHREAGAHVERMAYQLGYPLDAVLGGIDVSAWREVLRSLITVAIEARDRGEVPVVRSEVALVPVVASSAGLGPEAAREALSALAADREGVGWHAGGSGVAPPPLVRLDSDRVALSIHGLLTEPFFYLRRELRRRDPVAYHNVATARESCFREDLNAVFGDRRFVTATSRVVLRRDDGKARTDIDAAVFDRKAGALALFELKSQDPYARSSAELDRQRDNLLSANRQVSGILDWINRHGADEILSRMDRPASKRFRVRAVYPFVLGRYLAHFPDGPVPDRRAAWGTWPQVLRELEQRPIGPKDGNPIASLFTRLSQGPPPLYLAGEAAPRELRLGDTCLTVWPSYGAFRQAQA